MATLNVYQMLGKIQTELKVEKDQWNDFSKYKYRNAETILRELKPLLEKNGAALRLSDEIVSIGDFNYLKATAELVSMDNPDEKVSSTAYAREPIDKKGMDASQITGASSSYARKYALCGLFGIDDGVDADSFDNRAENVQRVKKIVPKKPPTDKQLGKIKALLREGGADEDTVEKYVLKITSSAAASKAIEALNQRLAQKAEIQPVEVPSDVEIENAEELIDDLAM